MQASEFHQTKRLHLQAQRGVRAESSDMSTTPPGGELAIVRPSDHSLSVTKGLPAGFTSETAGESVGGNLAAKVALMAKQMKTRQTIHYFLFYPVAGDDMNTDSYKQDAEAKPLGKADMEWSEVLPLAVARARVFSGHPYAGTRDIG